MPIVAMGVRTSLFSAVLMIASFFFGWTANSIVKTSSLCSHQYNIGHADALARLAKQRNIRHRRHWDNTILNESSAQSSTPTTRVAADDITLARDDVEVAGAGCSYSEANIVSCAANMALHASPGLWHLEDIVGVKTMSLTKTIGKTWILSLRGDLQLVLKATSRWVRRGDGLVKNDDGISPIERFNCSYWKGFRA